jgi:nitric oxide reductase subunit B
MVGRELCADLPVADDGLVWMACVNLFPIGALQFHDALVNGYWHARSAEFFARSDVRVLEWLRMPGDAVFIVGGIAPLVYLGVRMVLNRSRPGEVMPKQKVEPLTEAR